MELAIFHSNCMTLYILVQSFNSIKILNSNSIEIFIVDKKTLLNPNTN